MKTKMNKIVLVVFMLGTLINYANDKISTIALDAKKVKIEFKSVKKGQNITIKDNNGTNIYNQEIINAGDYSRLFNLSALNNGIYTIELNKDYEVLIQTFKVEGKLVTFLNDDNRKIYKPVIRTKEDLVLISKLNFNNEPLKITIFYKGDLILSETVKGTGVINKVYKLSENEKGNYSIVINTDNKTYIKDFSI